MLNARNQAGNTALHLAAFTGKNGVPIAKLLLQEGADPNM